MAFLNFIFKEKQSTDTQPSDHDESTALAEVEDVKATAQPPRVPDVEQDAAGPEVAVTETAVETEPEGGVEELRSAEDMDLDQLVDALQLISEFLDEGQEGEEKPSENLTSIPFTLEQLSDLMTDAFDAAALAKADTTKMMNVVVKDVYAQLGRGRVAAPVNVVLAEVAPELIAKGFDRFSEDDVEIPLQGVVAAVQPDELQSRTASEADDADLDSMPDLFGAGPAPKQPEPQEAPAARRAAPSFDDMPDPFALGAAAPAADETASDQPEGGAAEGNLKFELNENADIFNFSACPIGEESEKGAEIEAAPEVEPVSELEATTEAEPANEAEIASEAEPATETEAEPVSVVEEEPEAAPAACEMDPEPEPIDEVRDQADSAEIPDVLFGQVDRTPEEPDAEEAVLVPAHEDDGQVVLSGLDLNAADAEEMSRRLEGVGPRLAARIVRHREVNGSFRSVADLARVQGVGPSTYRKMTGKSWSEARDSLKRTLDYVLGTEGQDVPDLKGVARRIHSLSGFEGCVFAHSDGDKLAASWEHDKSDALGAVAPQMIKKMLPYVEELDLGDLNPLTLHLGDTAICVLQCGHVIMATVHRASGLSRRQVRLIELVGTELEQRFEGAAQA